MIAIQAHNHVSELNKSVIDGNSWNQKLNSGIFVVV